LSREHHTHRFGFAACTDAQMSAGALQQAVGRNVRAYRQRRGLSQEALAQLLGVHRTYMGGVERGERNLTLRSLERIAATLGLDPRDLLIDGVEND
jgi:transcriptional regulator with XRE-family HTH domain